jgi:hypothetical protein
MKKTTTPLLTAALCGALSLTTVSQSHGATLATTGGSTDFGSSSAWSPAQAPSSGVDSLSIGHNLVMTSEFTVANGQSMTQTAGVFRFHAGGDLTVATGGTLDMIGFYENGTGNFTRQVTFEAGATASTDRYINGGFGQTIDSGWTTKWIADVNSVTTFDITNDWQVRGGSIEVDLSNYSVANASTLTLADYDSLNGTFIDEAITGSTGGWGSLTLGADPLGDASNLEKGQYFIDYSGGTVTLLMNVPEPSSTALLGLGGLALALRRRRS